jgi:hypothetical protein
LCLLKGRLVCRPSLMCALALITRTVGSFMMAYSILREIGEISRDAVRAN